MNTFFLNQLNSKNMPVEIILVGLGFMGFGFISDINRKTGVKVSIVISRRPSDALEYLQKHGIAAQIENDPNKIKNLVNNNIIAVSDDLELIKTYENKIVFEVTGTVDYGTEVALKTYQAGKHLVTMNPELQATVGSELKKLFDQKKLVITDVVGDQPGSLARLIVSAKLKGFRPILAGNMKRYMDVHATQAKMKPWADDKGLAVRQTVSFTDGTKQSIEMTLVANYFGMDLFQAGMKGPRVERFEQVLESFDWSAIPPQGVVDFMIGSKLFPGVFIVAEHDDPNQQKYLRYLNMGDGPRYVLFDPYHLCHLEVLETILNVALFGLETINNGTDPVATTISLAKFDLAEGAKLDGIGGDTVYGSIRKYATNKEYLPVGISKGAVLKRAIPQDAPIRIDDVILADNTVTRLLGYVQ